MSDTDDMTLKDLVRTPNLNELEALELAEAVGVRTIKTFTPRAIEQCWERGYLTAKQVGAFYDAMVRLFKAKRDQAVTADGLGFYTELSIRIEQAKNCAVEDLRQCEEYSRSMAALDAVDKTCNCGCGRPVGRPTVYNFAADAVDDRDDEQYREQTLAWVQAHGIERDVAQAFFDTAVMKAEFHSGEETKPIGYDGPTVPLSTPAVARSMAVQAIRMRPDFEALTTVHRLRREESLREALQVLMPYASEEDFRRVIGIEE